MASSTFNIGLKTLKRIIEEGNALHWYRSKLTAQLFKGDEVEVFQWASGHVGSYHSLPSPTTLLQQFPFMSSVDCPEPVKYYTDLLDRRFAYDQINYANMESQSVLKEDKSAVDEAEKLLKGALDRIREQKYRTRILDVGLEAPKLVVNTYHKIGIEDANMYFGWPYMDDSTGGAVGGDVVSIVGRPAAGKAQPLDSKVLTSKGFKRMGDLQLGDQLASIDGKESAVTGIHPQGKKPVYLLTFQDGRTCEASDEHLWEIHYRDWLAPKVETTLQLIARLKKRRYQNRLSVRLFSGEFGREWDYLIDPYTLGALVGDGCFRAKDPRFTSCDPEILERVSKGLALIGCKLNFIKNFDYSIVCPGQKSHELKDRLKSLGLWGLKSEDKKLPESCFSGTRNQRLALLQGLMDTDGTAAKNGGQSFCSSSKILASQVVELVRSLGGKATLNLKKTICLDAWVVHVVMADRAEVFYVPRKMERSAPKTTHTKHCLVLKTIEYLEEKECQCISVSHESHLYITDNYISTHNTWLVLYIAIHNWLKGRNVLFASMEMNTLAVAQRIAAMYSHSSVGQLKLGAFSSSSYEIFYGNMKKMKTEPGKMYIVDGNLAAYADDLYMLAAQMKCHGVLIDGAYLMRHRNPRLDRYTKVSENVELMKQLGSDLNIPTFASWQFNRDASKKAKAGLKPEKAGLENIGYSDAIGQVSSIVVGLNQEDSVETLNSRQVEVLKGRSGEVGSFNLNWDFMKMNFAQILSDESKSSEKLGFL